MIFKKIKFKIDPKRWKDVNDEEYFLQVQSGTVKLMLAIGVIILLAVGLVGFIKNILNG